MSNEIKSSKTDLTQPEMVEIVLRLAENVEQLQTTNSQSKVLTSKAMTYLAIACLILVSLTCYLVAHDREVPLFVSGTITSIITALLLYLKVG